MHPFLTQFCVILGADYITKSVLTGLFCVHLWRGNELFEINFEFKWRSQPLRSPQQITFIMLARFWSLSKKLFTSPSPLPVFLTDNIKLDGMQTKIKLKIQDKIYKYFYISSFEKALLWEVIRYSYQFFYFLFCFIFYVSNLKILIN